MGPSPSEVSIEPVEEDNVHGITAGCDTFGVEWIVQEEQARPCSIPWVCGRWLHIFSWVILWILSGISG